MIQSFSIENFKSYKQATLKLAPLTVMIGANASGKSNALEAIRFLSWMAQGQKLSSLQYEVNQNNATLRGQIKDVFLRGTTAFSMACDLHAENPNDKWRLSMTLELRAGQELHIAQESISSAYYDNLYWTVKPTIDEATDIAVAWNNYSRGGKKPQVICSDQLPIFSQLSVAGKIPTNYKESYKRIKEKAQLTEWFLSNILFLDPQPSLMRDYSFPSDKRLKGNGENISAVLYNLYNTSSNQESENYREEILAFIKSLPEQDIARFDFLKGPRDEVMVYLEETFGNELRQIDASLLSDGTLRVLAIAAALLSAPKNSTVIIEEIDNGVHPSRAKQLLSQIYKIAERRKLQVILSTHNPALMDALPKKAIPDVVFCYRDKNDGYSQLVALKDVPDYPELIAQGSLGDLVTSDALSAFIKDYQGEEPKKERALKWLETIK